MTGQNDTLQGTGQNDARQGGNVDERPVTRFAQTPDGVSIAYQVTGEGDLDLLLLSGLPIPIDMMWEEPSFVRFAKRLGRFTRTIWSEARGVGASTGDFLATQDDETVDADFLAVLDSAGCDRVVLFGCATGGPVLIHFAAAHPDRVRALVLLDACAHYLRHDDYPWGVSPEELEQFLALIRETHGTTPGAGLIAPSRVDDEQFQEWYTRCSHLALDVDIAAASTRSQLSRDVRQLLPNLSVPTLVLHRTGDQAIQVEAGRYLAEHIPGARYVELPGEDHAFFVGATDAILDEVQEFLTGVRQGPEGDVVTATILFTDIVASTDQSARMGHRTWRTVMDDHDAMIRTLLVRYRGHEVATTGDGFLARFDSTTRAVRAAAEMVNSAERMGLQVRAGVHTGEVELRPNDVAGLSVSIAKRICDLAGPCQTLVSEGVREALVGSGISTSEAGTHELKGVPDEWRLYAVEDPPPPA